MADLDALRDAIIAGAPGDELAAFPLPGRHRAVVVRADEQERFGDLALEQRDPAASLHLDDVATPELAPDEVLIAVMASAINFTTVWTSLFAPISTFGFLGRLGKEGGDNARHDQLFHQVGSDAAGVIVRTGSAVRTWKPGDAVAVAPNHVDAQDPAAHDDAMLSATQRVWGYETNYGGLGQLAVAKASQLLPKAAHLTWEEAAASSLALSTSYRMLIGRHGARLAAGQTVLIWGASGGIGAYACQLALRAGAIPVGVVSSPAKAALLHAIGVEHVIDRKAEGYRFWSDEHTQDAAEWRRFAKQVRALAGSEPDVVFEHPGRETMGASVFTCARGGTVITCAATSGFTLEFDNRYLWTGQKTIRGSHLANYREAWEANQLVCRGDISPALSATFPFEQAAGAVSQVHRNAHEGKLGVLVLAPEEGLGVTDLERRASRLARITQFRRPAS